MSYTPTVDSTDRYATVDIAGERFTYPVSTATIAGVAAPIAGNNLLKASNNFSDSSWTKTRASAGATVDVTLDSGEVVTLTKLVEDGTASNTHVASQVPVARADLPFVARILVKQADAARNGIRLLVFGDSGSSFVYADFNVEAGTVTASGGSGAGVLTSAALSLVGGGAYECVLKGVPSVTANNMVSDFSVRIINDSNTPTYSGDSTSGVYIAQAQLTEGAEATTYNETTTERISGDGQRLTHSGDLANAAWTKTRTTISGSTHTATLDTGESLVMQKLVQDGTAANTHEVSQNSDVSALEQSIYKVKVKLADAGFPHARVAVYNGSVGADLIRTNINLSTGVLSSTTTGGTGSGASASVVSLGDGVYEVSLTGTPSTSAGTAKGYVLLLSADGSTGVFNGDSASGCYVAEPILVAGSTAPSYTRSYADRLAPGGSTRDRAYVQIPHIDDFDPAGIHIGTRWNTEQEWILTDGTDTATSTEQIAPPDADAFGSVGAGPYEHAPDGVTPGDDVYMHLLTGAGTFTPEAFGFAPTSNSTFRSMAYNVTDSEWLGGFDTSEDYVAPPSPPAEELQLAVMPIIRNVVRYII